MAVGIPLPELDLPRPAQNPAPDALSEFTRAAQLKTAAAQQQAIQAQTAAQEQQTQIQGLALKDEQLRRSLAPQFVQKDDSGKVTGFDNEGLYSAMLSKGADPLNIQKMRMSQVDMQKALLGLSQEKAAEFDRQHSAIQNSLEQVQSVYEKESKEGSPTPPAGVQQPVKPPTTQQNSIPPMIARPAEAAPVQEIGSAATGSPASLGTPAPGEVPTPSELSIKQANANALRPIGPKTQLTYQAQLMNLAQQGVDISRFKPHLEDARDIELAEAEQGSIKQARANAEQLAKTAEAAGKGAQSQTEAEAANWKGSDGTFVNIRTGQIIHAGGSPSQQAFQEYIKNGGNPLNFASDQAAREASNPALQSAKLHDATALKAAEQAITDGDPRAAARLLIDGTVAPSQIISSRKPAFAQSAFSAAAQMQPGWNAQKADADYNVAKSPGNLAFFGSSKSLTDPGGTIDQLKAAAKDIPQSEFPVFNSVADWYKAATGSGPIAKYAALGLGVADDYSKVMGGGQGSDTSRGQALNILAAKQSPEQRDGALDGIRGAVVSQTNSRIGNNPVLKKMYGSEVSSPAPTSSGKAVSLAAAKQLPQYAGKSDDEIKAAIEAYGHKVID